MSSDIKIGLQVESSFASLHKMKDEWNRFVIDCGSDIYMSFDWCRTWWNVFGGNRKLQIFLFRVENKLVGIFPLLIDDVGIIPFSFRIARFLYTDMTRGIIIPAVNREWEASIYQLLMNHLNDVNQCDLISFGLLSGLFDGMDLLRNICLEMPDQVRIVKDEIIAQQAVFNLPNHFDDYLNILGKRRRGNWRRSLKQLQEQYSIKMDVVRDSSEGLEEFAKFKVMHTAYWRSLGQKGHFGDLPDADQFMSALIQSQARRGGLKLFRLEANGEPIAYQLCFSFGSTCHWRLPARLSGEPWDRLGIGALGMMHMIQASIDEGITRIEAGPGHFDYKVQYGAVEYPVRSLAVLANRRGTRVRWQFFRLLKFALDTLYDKIWFYRLAPRLRLPRGPYWKFWLRMQF